MRDVLAAFGIEVCSERLQPKIPVSEAARRRVDDLLAPLGGSSFVALHVGSSKEGWRALKRLPLDVWLDVAARIVEAYDTPLVLVGSREDQDINQEFLARAKERGLSETALLDVGDRTTLPELVEVLSRAALFLGTDSGVAHAGSCSGTPLITVFLFSDYVGFAPLGDRSHVLARRPNCSPCLYRRGYDTCARRECFAISAEEIFEQAHAALASSGLGRRAEAGRPNGGAGDAAARQHPAGPR
ncbi:MAG: glycosyltransferase family 9 protein [Deltaproteobacteria bacterium]|nr:glycosyltransferase family 9 protein [Deltaproteobacteria bacterium]